MKERIEEMQGLCSVIMPVYNSEKYVSDAIESVLNQTYSNIELIIIDDCSTDNSSRIISQYLKTDARIKLIHNDKNKGCAFCRNIGVENSSGEYIAFIDSDDIWLPSKLDKQIKFMSISNTNMVYSSYAIIDSSGSELKKRFINDYLYLMDLLKENSVIFSTTTFKSDYIKDIYFQDKWYHEDYIFLLDYIKRYGFLSGLNEILVKYRVHSQGRSFNKLKAARFRWKIYRDYLHLSFLRSLFYYIQYAVNGWRKYK